MNVFDSYSPFIREFIYSRGWQSLSPVQVAAAEIIRTARARAEAFFVRPLLSLPLKPTTSFLREQFRHSRSKSFLTA